MGLDITLYGKKVKQVCSCCLRTYKEKEDLGSIGTTHNLNKMAQAADLYEILWNSKENKYKHPKQIIDKLKKGYHKLVVSPEIYKKYDSPNGWGTYEQFLKFLKRYIELCEKYPNATISCSK